ncbi:MULTISPECIES: hypothetical protein [Paraburkholderia]|uniref:hypothetical protein n=1 Tax=Paraburkholderia TaxID=1822464 RepID=UPI0022521C51|nr:MULTISPECIES: hypothetical protein [Paraburkholderia]MCX4155955.1 hypothetical protein [Paraburkholderia aspalathi]MDN7165362.1 hypothetical protein [Paraburkholderia sp. SECH2]MDQ6393848.1 hypothetical protein [Paraburkholderia aspalathi]
MLAAGVAIGGRLVPKVNDVRRRSAPEMLVVSLLALGIVSICFGLYSLIQAFDAFDLPTPFKIWFARALVAMAVGVIALHIGGKRAEAL